MLLRPMIQSDAVTVAALSADLGYPTTPADVVRRLERLRDWPDTGLFVAEDAQVIVGWVHVYGVRLLETEGYAEIGGIVVTPTRRQQGIGTQLIQACEHWAAQVGYPEVRLRSGVHRTWAHAFYVRLGYEQSRASYGFRRVIAASQRIDAADHPSGAMVREPAA
ncbi:GNAT family N-acetyltransferase [Herpetosiphon llansteffanensis]|uniref:GNAT family N-acetyltransferase n=1 Tax=Herpetosiphon llansteffanensis TaxID=2094568 RepID=UPI000D7C4DE6|nr:GNAT family N-acetyltransferase [Herpetosiphon llansteffanensis]